MTQRTPIPTLFPYTTLFRSDLEVSPDFVKLAQAYDVPAFSSVGVTSCGFSARKARSEEHTSELQSRFDLVCRLLLEKKKNETSQVIVVDVADSRGEWWLHGG